MLKDLILVFIVLVLVFSRRSGRVKASGIEVVMEL